MRAAVHREAVRRAGEPRVASEDRGDLRRAPLLGGDDEWIGPLVAILGRAPARGDWSHVPLGSNSSSVLPPGSDEARSSERRRWAACARSGVAWLKRPGPVHFLVRFHSERRHGRRTWPPLDIGCEHRGHCLGRTPPGLQREATTPLMATGPRRGALVANVRGGKDADGERVISKFELRPGHRNIKFDERR